MLKNITKSLSYQLLFIVCVISRIVTSIYYIEDIDSLRFSLSLDEYNILKMQPHFPGYPIYCFVAKTLYLLINSKGASFSIIGGLSVFTIIYYILKIGKIDINNRVGIFTAAIIFFNPMIWLMSNRYMPDLMGLAVAIASLYFITERKNDRLKLCIGFFLVGTLAGIRLSYIPLVALPSIYYIIVNRDRLILMLSLLLGCLIWFLPLTILTGFDQLYEVASKHTLGHFTEYGGTILTENDLLDRLKNLMRSIWADGLGGYWAGRSWQTIFLSIPMLYLLYNGFISVKKYLKYDSTFLIVIYCVMFYTLYIFIAQNIIYKTRHILPILIIPFLFITIGQKYVTNYNNTLLKLVHSLFFTFLIIITSTLTVQHRSPSAVSKLKDHLLSNDGSEKIISTPLINYYLKAHGVDREYIDIDDISRTKLEEDDQITLIGNFKHLFGNEYEISNGKIFYHNPYVNRMWSRIDTYKVFSTFSVTKN